MQIVDGLMTFMIGSTLCYISGAFPMTIHEMRNMEAVVNKSIDEET